LNQPVVRELPLVGQFDGGFEVADRHRRSSYRNDVPIIRGRLWRNTTKSNGQTDCVVWTGRDRAFKGEPAVGVKIDQILITGRGGSS
jgi:hypothetical protein